MRSCIHKMCCTHACNITCKTDAMHTCIHQMQYIHTYIHMYIHQIRYIQTCNCDIQIIHQIRYDAMHTSIKYDVDIHQIRYTHVSTYTSDAIRKYTHQIRRCDTCTQTYSRHATYKRAPMTHTSIH